MPILRITFLWLILAVPASAQIIGPPTGDICTDVDCYVPHPGYITGTDRWYPVNIQPGEIPGFGGNAGTNVVVCYFAPIPTTVTIKALGGNLTSAATGGFASFAIYNNDPIITHRPTTLIDYSTPASTTSTGAVSGAMHNTTDTLAPGGYWFCTSQDNPGSIFQAKQANSLTNTWSLGALVQADAGKTVNNVQAIRCTIVGTACGITPTPTGGTGWAIWAAGVPTWGNATGITWTDFTNNGAIIAMEVN